MYISKILSRAQQYYHDLNYDLRRIICCYSSSIVSLLKKHIEKFGGADVHNQQRMNILRFVCDLIEDDESSVKQQAFISLSELLPLYDSQEISCTKEIMHSVSSQVDDRMKASFEPETIETILALSVKILYRVRYFKA